MSMILYNLRYRGPFEYEKFVLDAYQLSNDAKYAEKQVREKNMKEIGKEEAELQKLFDEATGEKSPAMRVLLQRFDTEGVPE